MPNVEGQGSLQAQEYIQPLRFRETTSGGNRFHWVFSAGELRCSASSRADIAIASPRERTAFYRDRPSFVYMDVGAWADDSDGQNTVRRDFGIVCGPHVYLCHYTGSRQAQQSSVPNVQSFMRGMASQGRGFQVIGHALAAQRLDPRTVTNTDLYVILGDTHLPPVEWYYTQQELIGLSQAGVRNPPAWMVGLPAISRQRTNLLRNYYSLAQQDRERGNLRSHASDIFRGAGNDLVRFLGGLAGLPAAQKRQIHFLQTGDMFEMWIGRSYQFRTGRGRPRWLSGNSANLCSDWGLAILMRNTPVFAAIRQLNQAGLAESVWCWGNHDSYMMSTAVTSQLGLRARVSHYRGLHNDLWVEHGHRFDSFNFDQLSYGVGSGPWITEQLYHFPGVRSYEEQAQGVLSYISPRPEQRNVHIMGAGLMYMYQRYDQGANPFSIYIMGHTHRRFLKTVRLRGILELASTART